MKIKFDTKLPVIDTRSIKARSRNWTPMAPHLSDMLHEVVAEANRHEFKGKYGTGKLDKEVRDIDLFKVRPQGLEWGFSSDYIFPYMKWRKGKKLKQVALMKRSTYWAVFKMVQNYIRTGRPNG